MKSTSIYPIAYISLVLLSTNLFVGCGKSSGSPQPGPNYTFSANDLAYVQFTLGKYFIYRDSVTNMLDSVVVTQSSIQPFSHTSTGGSFDYSYSDQEYTFTLTQIGQGNNTVWLSGSGSSFNNTCTLYKDNPGFILYINYGVYVPSMVVEGKTYGNVLFTDDWTVAYYWWASGVGIIKRTEPSGTGKNTWTLVRHN